MDSGEFLERIERFLRMSDTYPTTFGENVMNDGSFVFDLRGGRSVTLKTQKKVLDYLASHTAHRADRAA